MAEGGRIRKPDSGMEQEAAVMTGAFRVWSKVDYNRKEIIMAKILSKKKRTLDIYKRVGAKMRLCRTILALTVCALGSVLTSDEWAKVNRAISLLSEACDAAESRMFRDYPDITDEYFAVFHGSLSGSPNSALDAEIRGLAKNFVDGFFM